MFHFPSLQAEFFLLDNKIRMTYITLRDVNIFPPLLQRKLTFLNIIHRDPVFPAVAKEQSKTDKKTISLLLNASSLGRDL